ncbi:unnamed protein product [Closterium sp. Naga37s-1]|nr:unnamed protein product [Closterium sp. Naga37s-1]
MAPAGDAPVSSAPGVAGAHGRKPVDARPDPVTPKTLFNGGAGPFGVEVIKTLSACMSALKLNDLPTGGKENGTVKPTTAGSSSAAPDVLEKGKAKVEDKDNDDGYLSDDPDECQDPEMLNEIAAPTGFAITLLIPFAWNKEVPRTINTVRHMLLVWGKHLSENVRHTIKFQQLSATYLSKKNFGRMQVVFLQAADANFVWSREVDHYTMNDKKLTLGWQHPENTAYLKEHALHPEAIEVLLRGGSGGDLTKDDTDKIKGLVYRHTGDKYKCMHMTCFHDEYVKERQNNIGNGGLLLLHAHEINGKDTHVYLALQWLQQRSSELISVLPPPRAAASLKLSAAAKIIMADPAISLTSVGGVREEWVCVQEECGKAHGSNFKQAVEHAQSQRHCTGLLKAGAATRQSRGKQCLADVRKEFGK